PATVLARLAGPQRPLVADAAVAVHFPALAAPVRDDPVAAAELGGDVAQGLEPHRVRERPPPGPRLLGQVPALHGDPEALGDGGGHAAKLPVPAGSGNRKP